VPTEIVYRGYVITYYRKPIPTNAFDYDFQHQDFDGGPWEAGGPPMDHRYGNASSVDDAKAQIDEMIEEYGE
jgi:hypothetical protein